jgi:hypothetical protein
MSSTRYLAVVITALPIAAATTEIYKHVSAARRRRVVQLLETSGHKKSFCLPRVRTPTSVMEVVKT